MPPTPSRPSTVHFPLMTAPTLAVGPCSSPALEDFTRSAKRAQRPSPRTTPVPVHQRVAMGRKSNTKASLGGSPRGYRPRSTRDTLIGCGDGAERVARVEPRLRSILQTRPRGRVGARPSLWAPYQSQGLCLRKSAKSRADGRSGLSDEARISAKATRLSVHGPPPAQNQPRGPPRWAQAQAAPLRRRSRGAKHLA
jgi:hypothetical protein